MLAQAEVPVEIGTALAALAGLVVAVGPIAILVTKAVDFVRNFDATDDWPKDAWIGLAMVIGVLIAVLFELNYIEGIADLVPALADSSVLDGMLGTIVTGLTIGAAASGWHEKFDLTSSKAKEARADAGVPH
jgi:hypothetical protein